MATKKPLKFKMVQPMESKPVELDDSPKPRKVTFYADELPIEDWKVGEEYHVIVCIRQKEMGIKDYGPYKGKTYAEFDLIEVAPYDE